MFIYKTIAKNLSNSNIYCILDAEDVENYRSILMNIRDKKILQTFPLHIWQANTGVWKAYIPDETRPNNRRVIQGKIKKNLEKKYWTTIPIL